MTAVWGSAFLRKPNGSLKPLNVGDKVGHGAQILTTMDGIVQISPAKGAPILVRVPADADKVIAGIEARDAELVPGAGLTGGPDGGLQPGLRVDRVKESVGQLEFEFGTERVPPATPIPFSSPKQVYFLATKITVDDGPLVDSVSSPTIAEGGNLDFQIKLTRPVESETPIALKLGNGTASSGVDTGKPLVSFDGGKSFTAIAVSADGSATVTVPAGTSADQIVVRVPTLPDSLSELDETFKVQVSTPGQGAPAVGTGTIIDATGQATLSISGPANVNEAAGTVTYTVTLSNPVASPVTVNFSTSDGLALAGKDYDATSGVLTFEPNQTTKTIVIPLRNDSTYEGAESFGVTISKAVGAVITVDRVTTTIHDDGTGSVPNGGTPDDDRPGVGSVSSPTIAEGGNLDFQVTLTHPSTTPTPITLKLGNGATPGTATPGSDTGSPQVSFDGGKTFNPITVDAEGNATITVPANTPADQIVVRVPTLPDNLSEVAETFKVTASTPINSVPVEGTGTIIDATGLPTLSISGPADVNEAAGTITYTVTLSNPSSSPVTVNYGTVDGSAQLGKDFAATAGTLTFAPNEVSKTITVAITNDGTYEGTESFKVQLSNPVGAAITADQVTTTIHDDGTGSLPNGGTPDDDRPGVGSVSSPTVGEGGNLDFQVTLTHPSTTPTPITLKLGNGTTPGTATPGTDTGAPQVSFDGGKTFNPITVDAQGNATITVPANTPADQIVVRVPTLPDNISELAETFKVTASTPINSAPVEGTGTITDATGLPTLSISGPSDVNEAAGTITYTVTLSNPSSSPVTVNYGTINGTAELGKDFAATAGTLTFAPNEVSKTITVAITNDGTYEGAESFTVQLSNEVGAAITTASQTTTIHDDGTGSLPNGGTPDDDRPVIVVSNASTTEGTAAVFTVNLGHPSSAIQPLQLTLQNGTAELGSDYTSAMEVSFDNGQTWQSAASGTANVPVGKDSLLVRVPTVDDATAEPSEAFTLNVSSAVAANGNGTGMATITDNDAPPTLDLDGNNSSGASDPGFKAVYVENGTGVRAVDGDVVITDVDSAQLTGATIKLSNPQAGDVLALAENLPAGITATVNGAAIVLAGVASLADYQTALHAIAFSSTSDNPSTLARTVDITVTDGTSNSNVATSVITVQAVNDAPAVSSATVSLSEEGLAGGVKDLIGNPDTTDATTVSGKIVITDPDSSNFSVSLGAPTAPVFTANGTQINWVSDGLGGLIGKAGTAANAANVVTATIDNTGQYKVTLLSSLKHAVQGEDSLGMNFTVKVSDGVATTNSTLTVNLEDDAPSAPANQSNTLSVQDSNLLFVLDISGSMNDPSGIGTLTRLQAAVQSMQKLLDKYDDLGTVAVRLVTFSNTAQTVGSSWLTVADAKASLATITATGGTNYDIALSTAQTAFATAAGKITGAQNVAYFFSDGNPTLSSANPTANVNGQDGSATQPNLGDGIDATEESSWSTFLNNNQINAFAIGLGSGVAQTYLNPIAYNGQFALNQDGIVVSNLNQLDSTLSGTVTGSVSGQIFASGNVGGAALGADGGHLASITLGGTVYTYDAAHPTLSVTTPLGSPFTLDWLTGNYTYKAPDNLINSQSETIGYSMVDGDGDIVGASLQLNLVLNAPVAGAPTLTATKAHVSEEGLVAGNKDTTGVKPDADTTDSTLGTGQITVTTTGGATVSGLVLTAPSASIVTASGKTVVWSSDNAGGLIGKDGTGASAATVATISVTKSGDYTFTLLQALAHSEAGEDVRDISFGVKVLDSTGKVGLGQLVVSVEDDAPVSGPTIVESLNTLDTNLMIVLDNSASMSNASGIPGLTRLDAAVQSIQKLLDKYDDLGGVSVRLVTFNTNAQTQGANWLSVAQAKALLATITADGGTNYDYALTQAQAAFNSGTGKIAGAQNVSYFFSDGDPTLSSTNPTPGLLQNGSLAQPNLGDGIDTTEEGAWQTFLNNNQIKSYAIGLGTGVTAPYLHPVAYDGQASENLNGTVVTSLDQLDTALSSTYGETISGNLVTSGKATAPMGADGFGHVDSVTVDGVTYRYNAANPSLAVHTVLGGELKVDMSTGAYTYGAPGQLSGPVTENVTFALTDKDGDTASSTLTINLDHTLVLVGTAQADTHGASQLTEFMMGRDGNDALTGSDASDRLYGNGGNDVLNGSKGDDVINGGDGNDTLSGGDGADALAGGPGSDVLTGGAGADVFVWHFADPGTSAASRAVDTIKDFSLADGDKLDLRDLLQGEHTGNLQNYLEFDTSTANTIIKVSPAGAFLLGFATNAAETERIVLENVNVRTGFGLSNLASDQDVINKMLTQGKLLVDQV
ncbi:MAG: VWA domain-containing protein [Aquabacterium sp.]|uniref:Calx-beta domain-containing protein n=1 Tax=Aquabacterium sp. TaxID=1872578 RepID=UPI0025B951A5|nr:Calx-beta domain-containing protein [Aquabacterium sp.]MBI5924119.1 VWA domain-containing protein [Aquabacterium sp.]